MPYLSRAWPDMPPAAPQYMAGGDLRDALVRDITTNGAGAGRCLGWYARGRRILVGVARGLVFMHSQGVRLCKTLDTAEMLLFGASLLEQRVVE